VFDFAISPIARITFLLEQGSDRQKYPYQGRHPGEMKLFIPP
jgi:hypothetical protein